MRPYRAARAPSRQVYESLARQKLGNWPCLDDSGAVKVFDFTVGTTGGSNTYSFDAITAWCAAVQDYVYNETQGMFKQGNDDAVADRSALYIYPGVIFNSPTRIKRGRWNLRMDVVSGTWKVCLTLVDYSAPYGESGYYPAIVEGTSWPFIDYYPWPMTQTGAGGLELLDYRMWFKCASFAVALHGNSGEARLRGYMNGETPNF
jgi:hypothetical protein